MLCNITIRCMVAHRPGMASGSVSAIQQLGRPPEGVSMWKLLLES